MDPLLVDPLEGVRSVGAAKMVLVLAIDGSEGPLPSRSLWTNIDQKPGVRSAGAAK